MRKLGATLLALPVILLVYLALVAKSAGRFKAAGFVAAAGLIALVLLLGSRPAPSVAVPPATTSAVEAKLLDAVVTGHGLKTPFTIGFDTKMDPASVAAALQLSPDAAVKFSWDAAGRTLTLVPVTAWAPDTLYTITVDISARAADGAPMAAPIRALILTTKGGTASLSTTRLVGSLAALNTAFAIHLDRNVALDALQAAVQTSPAVAGTVSAGAATGDYVFTPDAPLAPNTTYTIGIAGLTDGDGIAFATSAPITVTTVTAPGVVRFRPVNGAGRVDRAAQLSVRFTTAMNRRTTAAAFSVTAGGKVVAGRTAWAESNRVLVFTPASVLPYGVTVTMTVAATATSSAGVPMARAVSGTFTVKAKPAAAPAKTTKATTKTAPAPKPKPKPTPIPHPGGGGSGGAAATWYSVELYYLKLMNCTRTGGWVTSSGACSHPGTRNVAPLALSASISTRVSRPYAKYLSVHGLCNHFYQGTPGDRLRAAGFTSYKWAENIGCENISPYQSVLGSHLFFQSEKPYNGGHYVNMMNALYSEVGIGVWVVSGRTRLVVDFYHP